RAPQGGDRLPAAAAPARHRGGAGPHRRRRAPPRGGRCDRDLARFRRRRRADVMDARVTSTEFRFESLEPRAPVLAPGSAPAADAVVAGTVAVRPELVVESVRGALRGLIERERITVLVHPDDLETMRAAMDGVQATLGGVEHCEVQAERRVGRGGAVVRTPDGD